MPQAWGGHLPWRERKVKVPQQPQRASRMCELGVSGVGREIRDQRSLNCPERVFAWTPRPPATEYGQQCFLLPCFLVGPAGCQAAVGMAEAWRAKAGRTFRLLVKGPDRDCQKWEDTAEVGRGSLT